MASGALRCREVPDTDWQAAGERVAKVIDHKGWSQRELARRSGLSATQVNDIVRGLATNPQGKTLRLVAETLGWPSWASFIATSELDPPGGAGGEVDDERLRQLAREEAERVFQERRPPGPTLVARPGELVEIPIQARVRGNFGGYGHRLYGTIKIDPADYGGREMAAVEVEGQCMAPDVPDGSIAIYEVTSHASRGDIVIATLLDEGEEGSFVIKEYRQVGENMIELVPREGEPQRYRRNRVKIEGVVWEARQRLRR